MFCRRGHQGRPKPSHRGEPWRIPQHISLPPLMAGKYQDECWERQSNAMLQKHVSLLHGVPRPLEINIHRQMTVRLAIVSFNSILFLSFSLFLSLSLSLSHLQATLKRSNWLGYGDWRHILKFKLKPILIVKKMSSRLILKQFRNLIYWNSFQFRTGISILIMDSTKAG